MTRVHYLCTDKHKVTAPQGALTRCPLPWCKKPLTEVGPNWGPLRKKDHQRVR